MRLRLRQLQVVGGSIKGCRCMRGQGEGVRTNAAVSVTDGQKQDNNNGRQTRESE